MMKRLKFSDPMFVGRPRLKSNTMFLDMPRIELGVLRARERVESMEDTRDGRLVEMMGTHLWRLNVVFFKLDGTEDDEDDDDQTTQNKLLILVAKDAKTKFHFMNMFEFVLSCVTHVSSFFFIFDTFFHIVLLSIGLPLLYFFHFFFQKFVRTCCIIFTTVSQHFFNNFFSSF